MSDYCGSEDVLLALATTRTYSTHEWTRPVTILSVVPLTNPLQEQYALVFEQTVCLLTNY